MRKRNDYLYHQTAYYKTRAFLRLGILILILILALLGFFAYFSQYSGTFVISLDKYSQAGLSLCEKPDFLEPTSYLHASTMKKICPVEYKTLPIDNVLETDGLSHEPNCFGYTYYLKNVGETIVDVDVNVIQEGARQNLDKCSRILVLKDNEPLGVFKVTDNYIDPQDQTPPDLYRQYSGRDVYTFSIYHLNPNDIVKFTVIIWLEGWDIDCTDDKIGGAVQYGMTISITDYYEEEN